MKTLRFEQVRVFSSFEFDICFVPKKEKIERAKKSKEKIFLSASLMILNMEK